MPKGIYKRKLLSKEKKEILLQNGIKTRFQKGHFVSQKLKDKLSETQQGQHHSFDTEFKKGKAPWNKGTKGKMKAWNKGKHTKGNPKALKKYREKNGVWNKGLIGYMAGEKHHNWKGGISKNPYPPEFNAELKLKIRTRDNFICCLCGRTEREELEDFNRVLCVNHIDFNKNNCKENNLNTLCSKCNTKINREREFWTDYFQKYAL